MLVELVKRTLDEMCDHAHENIKVTRDPCRREWVVEWREPLGDVRVAAADIDVEFWPSTLEGNSRAACAYQIAVHPAALAAFYRRVPPHESSTKAHAIDVLNEDIAAGRLKIGRKDDTRVSEGVEQAFRDLHWNLSEQKPFEEEISYRPMTIYVGGEWGEMTTGERAAGIARALSLGRKNKLESGPSAVEAAPPVQRGPLVFCQSQYDPDE
jgi:hypothetical protein